jgi:C4-dicarboxylate transporter DctQ subunit
MFRLFSSIIGHINQKIAVLGIAIGVSIAFLNVVARYVFDASLVWATELTIFAFLWSVFFGAAYCFKKDAHIAVTVVLDNVSSRLAKVMLLISHLITFIFLVAVAYYGYEYLLLVIDLDERSIDLWDMPMWIIYLVIPVSFAFGAYRVAERIHGILATSHDKILKESEAEMVLAELGVSSKDETNKNVKELNDMVKEVDKKTGGML